MKAYYTESEKEKIRESVKEIIMNNHFCEWDEVSEAIVNDTVESIMENVIKSLVTTSL